MSTATEPASTVTPMDLTPRPGAAPLGRMVATQAGMELRVLVRNGEQVLLTLVVPVLLLVAFSTLPILDLGTQSRVDFLAPGVLALAVLSTAFTGQAIGTGFERKYGVLKRLGATPLPRVGLIAAKTLAVLALQTVQFAVLVGVALALGWSVEVTVPGAVTAVGLVLLATAAFSALALLMAGTLRAEATLAAANLVFLILLGLGGIMFPIDRLPGFLETIATGLPITALSEGLRGALTTGGVFPLTQILVLLVWAVVGTVLASRLFRWE